MMFDMRNMGVSGENVARVSGSVEELGWLDS